LHRGVIVAVICVIEEQNAMVERRLGRPGSERIAG
jgi:hypothetical protein